MKKTKYVIETDILEGSKVHVKNYRRKYDQWETGIVQSITAGLRSTGKFTLSFDVRLDRKSYSNKRRPWGTPLDLRVGVDSIKLLTNGEQEKVANH